MRLSKYLFTALFACMVWFSSFALADVPAIPFAAMTAVNFDVGWAQPVSTLPVDSVQADEKSFKSYNYDIETATTSGNHRMWSSPGNTAKTIQSTLAVNAPANESVGGLATGVIRGSATL